MRSSSSGPRRAQIAGSKKAFTARCAEPTQSGSVSEAGLVGASTRQLRVLVREGSPDEADGLADVGSGRYAPSAASNG